MRPRVEDARIFMKLNSVKQDFWIGILLLSLCLLAYLFVIPAQVQGESQRGMPPTFFPNFSVVWIGVFSVLVLIRSFVSQTEAAQESPAERRSGRNGAMFTISAGIVYVVLCSLFSFVISTVVFLAILMWALGERRWHFIVSATLVTTLGIYVVFVWLMSVQLPEGMLF